MTMGHTEEKPRADHEGTHWEGDGCETVQHGEHEDHLHDGHRHYQRSDHVHEP